MNIKKTWSGIREIVNIQNSITPKITQLNINGKIIENPKAVANQLNNFFVNVGLITVKHSKIRKYFSPEILKTKKSA